jgi:probable aminopeptidase NPEPL1
VAAKSDMAAGTRASGDLTHPLIYCPEFTMPQFKSQVADMRNSVKDRMDAQSRCACLLGYG